MSMIKGAAKIAWVSPVNSAIPFCFVPHPLVRCYAVGVLWLEASSFNQQPTVVSVCPFNEGVTRKYLLHIVVPLTTCAPDPHTFSLVQGRSWQCHLLISSFSHPGNGANHCVYCYRLNEVSGGDVACDAVPQTCVYAVPLDSRSVYGDEPRTGCPHPAPCG